MRQEIKTLESSTQHMHVNIHSIGATHSQLLTFQCLQEKLIFPNLVKNGNFSPLHPTPTDNVICHFQCLLIEKIHINELVNLTIHKNLRGGGVYYNCNTFERVLSTFWGGCWAPSVVGDEVDSRDPSPPQNPQATWMES